MINHYNHSVVNFLIPFDSLIFSYSVAKAAPPVWNYNAKVAEYGERKNNLAESSSLNSWSMVSIEHSLLFHNQFYFSNTSLLPVWMTILHFLISNTYCSLPLLTLNSSALYFTNTGRIQKSCHNFIYPVSMRYALCSLVLPLTTCQTPFQI